MKKIAIIGAGISGLTLAYQLKAYADIVVFEKARGVGGRMSTRYGDQFEFDHAAQFFTARSNEFKQFLVPFIEKGEVAEWQPRVLTISKGEKPYKRDWFEPHYVGSPRMNSFCKALADAIAIEKSTEVAEVIRDKEQWIIKTKSDQIFEGFDWVISSAPVPQTLNLLPKSFEHTSTLSDATMQGCMTLMLGVSEDATFFFDAAVVKNSPITWIAHNSSKPGRDKEGSITLNTSGEWAEEHMEDDLEVLKQELIKEAIALLDIRPSDVVHASLHRWRYADVATTFNQDFLLDKKNRLAACGDWCLGGRVENAFLSGYRLAHALKEQLS